MEANSNMKLEALKARIARSEYVVDPDVVAQAIVERLVMRPALGPREGSSRGASPAGSRSGDVLEAG
jgi:hypothetical protein